MPPLSCPVPLERLRRALASAVEQAGGRHVQAQRVLADAGAGQSSAAWARLRALAAAYYPEAACAGLFQDLNMEGSTTRGPDWARAGAGQLVTLAVSGANPATILNHASRHVARLPAEPSRQRLAQRLLADAASLNL